MGSTLVKYLTVLEHNVKNTPEMKARKTPQKLVLLMSCFNLGMSGVVTDSPSLSIERTNGGYIGFWIGLLFPLAIITSTGRPFAMYASVAFPLVASFSELSEGFDGTRSNCIY